MKGEGREAEHTAIVVLEVDLRRRFIAISSRPCTLRYVASERRETAELPESKPLANVSSSMSPLGPLSQRVSIRGLNEAVDSTHRTATGPSRPGEAGRTLVLPVVVEESAGADETVRSLPGWRLHRQAAGHLLLLVSMRVPCRLRAVEGLGRKRAKERGRR